MRWIAFAILAYVAAVLHTTLAAVLAVPVGIGGTTLRVDLLAAVAVSLALRSRSGSDAVLAGWILGLLLDLVSPVDTPLGLNAICFGIGAALVYHIREAVFSDNPMTQVLTALLFVLVSHGTARLFVNLYVRDQSRLWPDFAQVVLVAVCTGAIMPLVAKAMGRVNQWVLLQPTRRRRR